MRTFCTSHVTPDTLHSTAPLGGAALAYCALLDRLHVFLALDDSLHEDARRVNAIRVQLTRLYELLDFGDCHATGGRHHRVEIARRLAVDEIALRVAFPGLHERDIRRQSGLEAVRVPVDDAGFLAFGDDRPRAGFRVEAVDPGSAGTNTFGQRALRIELEHQLAGEILPLELSVLADV